MVRHNVAVSGVNLAGVAQSKPVLLQINDDEFPKGFLQELGAIPSPSTGVSGTNARRITHLPTAPAIPVTLYQPVQRVTHLALVQLACESVGYPRLDPRRVESAGLVIRRVPQWNGVNNLAGLASPWVSDSNGQFSWILADPNRADDDPDPTRRPSPQTGQPALNQMLAAQTLAAAYTEINTPAFVAAPDVCNAAQRTLVYAVIPTASSESSSQAPPPPAYEKSTLLQALPTLLKAGPHASPQADQPVNYQWMSDDFAKAHNGSDFLIFSNTLRMMYTVFGVFDGNADAQSLLGILNRRSVTVADGNGGYTQVPMGQFYQTAAATLIDYDQNADPTQSAPQITMPLSWDFLSVDDQNQVAAEAAKLLAGRSAMTLTPQGRFQDASRLYRLRLFFRIKSENPGCPPQLVWSCYSDPFRIAAWHESSGRVVPPVVLPDPTDPNVLKSLKNKPNCAFAVPAGLMNSMQGVTLSGLSSGAGGGGGGINLNWICGFSIPLITICAFFVLNIFLTLLNIVFFWLPFIKICIPFPFSPPPGAQTGNQP
ncbi:MAG TPA: hypothetical protein VMG35_19120 [Bryobacteraceae bacterium]|nr:hypothetical protein [Bryobacteraceae bacterium]